MRAWVMRVGLAAAVVALLVGANVWLGGWSGVRAEKVLSAGQSLVMDSGVTLTVPEGWSGRWVRYWHVPLWLPVGDAADLGRSDYVLLKGEAGGEQVMVSITSFRRGGKGAQRVLSQL
ncbi:hypothetical protein MX659_08985 [Coriobacteriia bacterium Es71-Z0120]|uniref:hypothetical protein n=1 Tax=Parvivirga hydrogeniphila TaxID=2939460 RepID=UPI002260FC79|nr:hypothetical protein [Parvivirga hydrogeniphila]MCL4079717.1 hypothetical protein [Parvivirga hydrogeniphila]